MRDQLIIGLSYSDRAHIAGGNPITLDLLEALGLPFDLDLLIFGGVSEPQMAQTLHERFGLIVPDALKVQ